MKKLKYVMIALGIGCLSPSLLYASDVVKQSQRDTLAFHDEQVGLASRTIDGVKAALMAYYTENMAWPATLNTLSQGANSFYQGSFTTPLGPITGTQSGKTYTLVVKDPIEQGLSRVNQFKLLAGKQGGTYDSTARTMTSYANVPHSASIVRNMISRLPDTTGQGLNTMQTDIDMGGFDLKSVKSLTVKNIVAVQITANSIVTSSGANLDAVNVLSKDNEVRLDALTNRLTDTEGEVQSNADNILQNTNALNEASGEFDVMRDLIAQNQQNITHANEDINELNTNLGLVADKVLSIDGRVRANTNAISNINNQIVSLQSADRALSSRISTAQSKANSAYNKAANAERKANTAYSTANSLNSRVSRVEQKANSNYSTITSQAAVCRAAGLEWGRRTYSCNNNASLCMKTGCYSTMNKY